ncbi:hypothetical protein, partial [Delftia acidovorans]|uniref:hypothetical protein n=1 Tax=Delftia acidovorans TaxID=80866 RepID=UPI0035A02F5E
PKGHCKGALLPPLRNQGRHHGPEQGHGLDILQESIFRAQALPQYKAQGETQYQSRQQSPIPNPQQGIIMVFGRGYSCF